MRSRDYADTLLQRNEPGDREKAMSLLCESLAIAISKETCQGLEFAHSRGIVHRDLKPGNVRLTGDGTAIGGGPTSKSESLLLQIPYENGQGSVLNAEGTLQSVPADVAADPRRGNYLYLATAEGGTIDVFDIDSQKVDSLAPEYRTAFKPTKIKFQPKSSRFWVSSYNALCSCDLDNSWAEPIEVTSTDDCINDFDFSPGGNTLYAAYTYSERMAVVEPGQSPHFINLPGQPWNVQARSDKVFVFHQGHDGEAITVIKR